MLPAWRYNEARREAAYHLQVRVLHVAAGVRTPGQARVQAEVVRVFRGAADVAPGTPVNFHVSVLTGDEPRERIPIGGTLWTNYADLHAAGYLEVYLDGTPPDCQIRLWQQAILAAPTDRPTMPCPLAIVQLPKSWLRRALHWLNSTPEDG